MMNEYKTHFDTALEDYIGKISPRIVFTARPSAAQLHVCED